MILIVLATNSGKKDRDKSDPLLATLDEIACISPILLTDAKDSKKSVFLVTSLNVASSRGSNGCFIKATNTLLRSQEGGDKVFFFISKEKDLINCLKICDDEISGNFKRNTHDNIDLYPLIDDTVKFLFLLRSKRKSAILGRVGRETETPFSLHHLLKTDHFC